MELVRGRKNKDTGYMEYLGLRTFMSPLGAVFAASVAEAVDIANENGMNDSVAYHRLVDDYLLATERMKRRP